MFIVIFFYNMKRFIFLLGTILMSVSWSSANSNFDHESFWLSSSASYSSNLSILDVNSPAMSLCIVSDLQSMDYDVHVNIEMDDDALECTVTVTVKASIGGQSVTLTGTVTGPCDEVGAAAIKMVKDLINEARDFF